VNGTETNGIVEWKGDERQSNHANGMEWNGMSGTKGMEWNGMEWNGMDRTVHSIPFLSGHSIPIIPFHSIPFHSIPFEVSE
jgi:hypothetical protein